MFSYILSVYFLMHSVTNKFSKFLSNILGKDQYIGRLMCELDLRKQPVNILSQKIRDYAHRHPEVEKLMALISNMVVFTPADRPDARKVENAVADVHKAG